MKDTWGYLIRKKQLREDVILFLLMIMNIMNIQKAAVVLCFFNMSLLINGSDP